MNKIKGEIGIEIVNSMKEKNAELVSIYRGIMAKIIEAEKNNGNQEISEEAALKVIEKLAKQREESITLYKQGGREDLVKKEQFELSVLVCYLPQKMDEAATREAIEKGIKNGATNIGLLMKDLKQYGNLIDNKVASKLAMEYLK